LLSEDYSFCDRAWRCGFQPWLYTGAELLHVGACLYGA
jgi:hypothetical protein